jgi:hypothetical protein
MRNDEVDIVRVDLPVSAGNTRWLFVERGDGSRWHPWWGELFRFLLELGPREPAGVDQEDNPVERAMLTGAKRVQFAAVVANAPKSEVERHRTLRSASRLLAGNDDDVVVRYFRKARVPADR